MSSDLVKRVMQAYFEIGLAELALANGNSEAAKDNLLQILEIIDSFENEELLKKIYEICEEINDLEFQAEYFSKVYEKTSEKKKGKLALYLGYLYEELSDKNENALEIAKNYYLIAITYEINEAFFGLGNIYFELGDYEKAVECYKEFLKYFPEDEDAKENLRIAKEEIEKVSY